MTTTLIDWYAVLGVAPDAAPDDIRAAWLSAISDCEPGDPTFRVLNQAAEILLDPPRRAEYDESLASQADAASLQAEPRAADDPEPTAVEDREATPPRLTPRPVPGWLLVALALAAALAVAWSAWMAATPSDAAVDAAAREAQSAAERAVVPVLAYDAADMDGSQAAAHEWLTPDYREDYDKLFQVLADNADQTGTKVSVEVLSSGVVRASGDRVDVLVFVDRPTVNRASTEPVVYRDQVTLTMERVEGDWLVDSMTTSPARR